ncbi:MAG: glycosyltransferase [Bradyrhizobium sp.]|nr:glycosyltransferase [Bradyrhizobium sp.]
MSHESNRRLRVLTWHLHGNYLYYLSQAPHDFYIITRPGDPPGYAGRVGHLPWGENVKEVPFNKVAEGDFDCILFQARQHYLHDQFQLMTPAQRRLPKIYLEHDPPQQHPTNTPHWVEDERMLLVHVTAFNALMWDNANVPVRVIEHGVMVPDDVTYSGELDSGITVVNNLAKRGRRLGADVFAAVRAQVPVELVGMDAEAAGGRGEVANPDLAGFIARYRFFFNPIRYTSLGLAVIEAMMVGLPVVALATTEMVTVIRNGENGYVDTRLDRLVDAMRELLRDPSRAQALGKQARADACVRFGMQRFVADWNAVLAEAVK